VSTLAGSICLVNSRQRPHGGYTYSKPSPSCQTATVLAIWYSPDSVSPWRRWRCAQHKPVPEPVSTQTPEKRLPAAVYEYRRHVSEEAITDRMRVEHPLRRVDEHRFDVLSTTVNLLRSRASLCNHGGARREDPPLTTQMTTSCWPSRAPNRPVAVADTLRSLRDGMNPRFGEVYAQRLLDVERLDGLSPEGLPLHDLLGEFFWPVQQTSRAGGSGPPGPCAEGANGRRGRPG